jgi:lipoprotein-releasing system ATP-binding protein
MSSPSVSSHPASLLPASIPQGDAPALRCENLHRHLGDQNRRTHVLRGVSFAAQPGRVYAVVGPSGCGKSTLLYQLGLLDRPDDGQIWINGQLMSGADDVLRTAARARHLGFVFQFHFLLLEFTALENVMLPMRKLGRLTPAAMETRARDLLVAVGLGDKVSRAAAHLSGGEQQRVAIARALANAPTAILADEPTGNLDAKNSELVFDLLIGLARQNGQTVVMVTHNPEIAARCDFTRPMRDGQFVT